MILKENPYHILAEEGLLYPSKYTALLKRFVILYVPGLISIIEPIYYSQSNLTVWSVHYLTITLLN